MKTLKEIIDSGRDDDIKIDSTLAERYGPGPLLPHKIERAKALVKETVLDPTVKPTKVKQENSPTPV